MPPGPAVATAGDIITLLAHEGMTDFLYLRYLRSVLIKRFFGCLGLTAVILVGCQPD